MTRRGRLTLILGLLSYVVARVFGSSPLYPVAIGLVFAAGAASLTVRFARRPIGLRRDLGAGAHVEGEDVWVRLEVETGSSLPAPSVLIIERVARLGEITTALRRGRGGYVLERLRRGRYLFADTRAVIEDPFGLARLELPLQAEAALLVQPRLVELDRLFSDSGTLASEGRRLLLSRPSGFDLHSVRDYEQGESLRKVHWRSTAKRGQLMVKELEEAPRDEVAVLLDAQAAAVVGESFDVQVRAAGSILRAQAHRGRRALLFVNGARPQARRIHSLDRDWRAALDSLAAAEPTGTTPASVVLADGSGPVARALELTVITGALSVELVERLLSRTRTQRRVSLVWIEIASFGPAPKGVPQPLVVRLQAGGVPVAVVRAGDDLRARLSYELSAQRRHA